MTRYWSEPFGLDQGHIKLNRLLGELGFKVLWRAIIKSRVQPLGIVDLFDEPRQSFGNIGKAVVTGNVYVLDFQGLHEALCLRIVIGVWSEPFGLDQGKGKTDTLNGP